MILKKHDRTDQKDHTCVSMRVLGGKKKPYNSIYCSNKSRRWKKWDLICEIISKWWITKYLQRCQHNCSKISPHEGIKYYHATERYEVSKKCRKSNLIQFTNKKSMYHQNNVLAICSVHIFLRTTINETTSN